MLGQSSMAMMVVADWGIIPNNIIHKMVITYWIRVSPNQRYNCSNNEEQRVVSQKIPNAIHINTHLIFVANYQQTNVVSSATIKS